MQNKNLKLVIIAVVAIAAGLVWIFLFLPAGSNNVNLTNSDQPRSPQFEKGITKSTDIIVDDNVEFNYVSQLPVYLMPSGEISKNQSQKIATNLGFAGTASVIVDPETNERIYIWSTEDGYLRIASKVKIIEYSNNGNITTSSSGFFSEAKLREYARDGIQDALIDDYVDLQVQDIEYLRGTYDGNIKSSEYNANIAIVKFVQKLDSYDVINDTPEIGQYSVSLDKDGNITHIYVDYSSIASKGSNVTLKGIEEITDSLDQAVLKRIDDGNIDSITFNTDNMTNTIVSRIETAYFKEYSTDQRVLQPIYVLYGETTIGNRAGVPVVFYLDAISQN